MRVLVTGGCGFIGSNFIRYLLANNEVKEDIEIINLDKLTYAGQGRNIEHANLHSDDRYKFFKADIADKKIVEDVFSKEKPELVFSFAAESHVDRSIKSPDDFIKSNVVGAVNIFEVSKKYSVKKVVQISTDEVYGSISEGKFDEDSKLNPSSPYSSSKAAADLIGISYFKTHKIPIIITRSANNYGPYQFPEKILPLFITNLIENKEVPLMWSEENPGLNVRDWLHVEDNCRAIWFVSQNGKEGEIYNIPGGNERTNIDVTKKLLEDFGCGEEMIEKIQHRKGHDFRYAISGDKLRNLGFRYKHDDFDSETKSTVKWYRKNKDWWLKLKDKARQ